MAKRRKSKVVKKVVEEEDVEMSEEENETKEDKLTLAKLDAISDEDDDGDNDEEDAEYNAEARALRQAIAEGVFDNLGKTPLGEAAAAAEVNLEEDDDDASEEEESADKEKEEEKVEEQETKPKQNTKALMSATAELTASMDSLPWPERFDVSPPTALPFGQKMEDGTVIDIHDDLKRELVFYNLALEAAHVGRQQCTEHKIPFSRPEDFFAEMIKTDDHMAKVKDRLIYESKKMGAFEQRKSNREQKLRAKEAHSHRLEEKAKSKKRHMQDVEEWAKSAASNRVGGSMLRDDDDEYLNRMNGNNGPNKKRMAMNKKYGFGGKRGKFKQNDPKSMNDMSGYNPKGNFSGGKKSAGGGKRKGKRARDASKARG